jgi:2-keto-4-pentenoate hydratase/2-oxohepta-3-ene-1,7-dioic acid hydratase in catechol pathway
MRRLSLIDKPRYNLGANMNIPLGLATYTPQRIFCIGRNYRAHIAELDHDLPVEPVVFCKPATCLVPVGAPVPVPRHGKNFHYETELVVLVGQEGRPATVAEANGFVAGLSLGLDLTLRDVQQELTKKGLPWELSKAFDHSAPIGTFVTYDPRTMDLAAIDFTCHVNNTLKQQGHTKDMIFSVETLLMALAKVWALLPGDLIYTGTPAGVGPLQSGDTIGIQSKTIGTFAWKIA